MDAQFYGGADYHRLYGEILGTYADTAAYEPPRGTDRTGKKPTAHDVSSGRCNTQGLRRLPASGPARLTGLGRLAAVQADSVRWCTLAKCRGSSCPAHPSAWM